MGKTIELYLVDGAPDGVTVAKLSNWIGRLIRIPRRQIAQVAKREDLQTTGIYFLFGVDQEDNPMVYIGESDNVYRRLNQHNADENKEFWYEAVAVIASDDSLNKAHVRKLELLFYEQAKSADRYVIFNPNKPSGSTLSESDLSTMEEFASHTMLVIGALQYKLFERLSRPSSINLESSTTPSTPEEELIYELKTKGARGTAYGYPVNAGFLVLQGSYVDLEDAHSPHISAKARLKREELAGNPILAKDALFATPSAAAQFIANRSSNGWVDWKTKDGRTLHDVVRAQSTEISREMGEVENDSKMSATNLEINDD